MRAAAVVLAVAALYGRTLGHELVWDDRLMAVVPDAAPAPRWAYVRPLVLASFAVDRAVGGGAPWAFHLTNLAAHAAAAVLVGALAVRLGAPQGVALAAALAFAAHPVQTEAVAYVSGRTDVLCAVFVLLALLAWRRAARAWDLAAVATAALVAAALGCKEVAVLVPLVLLVPGAHPARRPPWPLVPGAVALAWLVAFVARGTAGAGLRGLGGRLPAIAVAVLEHVRLVVWPAALHLERFVVVPGWSPGAVAAAWLGVGLVGAGLLALARRAPGGVVLLALAVTTYLPVANLAPVYPAVADRVLFAAEHFLYLPLAGLAPLVAGAWPRKAGRAGVGLVAAVLIAWSVVTVDRVGDWRDEETLFRDTVAHAPPVARVWYDLANLRLAAGDPGEAERLYRAALERAPHDADVHWNLGIALHRQGRLGEALGHYREAVHLDPRLAAKLGGHAP